MSCPICFTSLPDRAGFCHNCGAAVLPRVRRPDRKSFPVGQVFRDAPFAPEMVVVPAGEFLMGSSGSEEQHRDDEGPRHGVKILKSFSLGRYPVTFDEWEAFIRRSGYGYRPDDEDWGRGLRPVINVSWDDAVAYVEWLSQETGQEYRLPSESEWEYGCRAGTTTRFSFGDRLDPNQANFDATEDLEDGRAASSALAAQRRAGAPPARRLVDRPHRTMEVGSFPANAFGLFDMHGNVWEWVADCWHPNYDHAPWDGSPWTGDADCGERVTRGGSWNFYAWDAASAHRMGNMAGNRYFDLGFRVAVSL